MNPSQEKKGRGRGSGRGKREWDEGSTKRRWVCWQHQQQKALDWIWGGEEEEKRRKREGKGREEQERDDEKGMDGIPLAEFRQATEPVSASFQLLWCGWMTDFWRGGERESSRRAAKELSNKSVVKSQESEVGISLFFTPSFLSLSFFPQAPISKGLDLEELLLVKLPAYTDIPLGENQDTHAFCSYSIPI
ncbi:hypothetical protein BO83DRAFT_47573 [Aspergillus eucalypticola CBS 122712]|uniref:Uncharacterized protein n=1 Tax=Aspergillus eucalypticola (strain CBS 122712 / IBT 29274) TaxID=1448314 RepID=A0A317VCS4_ASPEC|nr:uncharacterized protein BO83DRAFT_47573 [Aspergillus eucalypticola CBS 122712]PWY72056.1 hypothetical protein BO83DRAFT_47573 [Aspergillus eucalypticola CBS 122712]